ncbi:hypothetical protein B0T22DRAFT_199956 [Podospora appendiculata]|uniref:C2H2-type domain-containing protein n=1 Tax=Podospora appendiculata TaxID=314037 RepID=A0AAE1C9T2_9PEZI|nr:hypothetical protein B0T22DRAFT_199956 [Podospora appendiculata]
MDPGSMNYNSRPVTSAPLQLPSPASTPHFFNPAFSAAPMTSMMAQSYSPQVAYGGYSSYSPSTTPLASPFKLYQYPERPQLHVASSEDEATQGLRYPRDGRSYVNSRSPSVKSDVSATERSTTSSRSSVSRTMTTNITVDGKPQAEFNTHIDTLMKTIQVKSERDPVERDVDRSPAYQDEIKTEQPPQSPSSPPNYEQDETHQRKEKPRKRYLCKIQGCGQRFGQKTHLDTHHRSHTGEEPFGCDVPGCGKRFTQRGNLTTHMRRHNGERPYPCNMCGKRFVQGGGLRAHLKTHAKSRPFTCMLDGCGKKFTALGNMKHHQNKFHADVLNALIVRFSSLEDTSKVTKEDREMWEYFATIYKNSNKGIKGRGKRRKVEPTTQPKSGAPTGTVPSQYPVSQSHGHAHAPDAAHHLHHPTPHHGLSAHSMSRPHLLVNQNARGTTHNSYEMFDADDDSSVNGSGPSSTTSGHAYDEDQGRDLAFGDRIYRLPLYA